MSAAYLLVSHGSRDPRPQVAMEELAQNLSNKSESNSNSDAIGNILSPTKCDYQIGTAYLELHPQPLHEQIVDFSRKAIANGCRSLKILPLFLLPGIHVTEDIPEEVELAKKLAKKTLKTDISIELQPYLGSQMGLQRLLANKVNDISFDSRIILAHGSRRVEANSNIESMAISLNAVAAYWAVAPSLQDIVVQLAADGKKKIAIIPYFLFAGGITDAIAESIQDLKLQFPGVSFQLYETLGRKWGINRFDLGFDAKMNRENTQKVVGKVYLVGAGPGDPGLMTLKGKALLETADVVIYDALASPEILAMINPLAEKINAGKRRGRHSLPQNETTELLIKKAQDNAIVVRLKGGDPFVFGRGGEEMQDLLEAGISVEVVPGITSGIAAPAYAGIPLTHRLYSSSVTFVTGHESVGKYRPAVDWLSIAKGSETIVIYMGIQNLAYIIEQLLKAGLSKDTPIGLIRWGTRPEQEELIGKLATIIEQIEKTGFEAPAIVVIGAVVKLHSVLGDGA